MDFYKVLLIVRGEWASPVDQLSLAPMDSQSPAMNHAGKAKLQLLIKRLFFFFILSPRISHEKHNF